MESVGVISSSFSRTLPPAAFLATFLNILLIIIIKDAREIEGDALSAVASD
jgi:acetylglutamate synthase